MSLCLGCAIRNQIDNAHDGPHLDTCDYRSQRLLSSLGRPSRHGYSFLHHRFMFEAGDRLPFAHTRKRARRLSAAVSNLITRRKQPLHAFIFICSPHPTMSLGLLRGVLFISVVWRALSIPLDPSDQNPDIVLVTAVITTKLDVLETKTVFDSPVPLPTSLGVLPSDESASLTTEFLIVTQTVTATPATTITIDQPSPATTDSVIVPPSSCQVSPSNQATWVAPPRFTDLSSFGISLFAYGKQNLQLVPKSWANTTAESTQHKQPSEVAALGVNASLPFPQSAPTTVTPPPEDPQTLIRIFYPQGSINPGSDPQGGADFYSSPLDFSHARNVTLEYSVFFPLEFEWALAGKLPGLYGGHTGCSGGNDARSCFSTRLMWRQGGKGELYLVSSFVSIHHTPQRRFDIRSTHPKTNRQRNYALRLLSRSATQTTGSLSDVAPFSFPKGTGPASDKSYTLIPQENKTVLLSCTLMDKK